MPLFSQIEKGTIRLGLGFKLSNTNNKSETEQEQMLNRTEGYFKDIETNISFGYFIENNFEIGLNLGYLKYDYSNNYNGYVIDLDRISVGPRITYNIKLSEKLYLPIFGQAQFSNQIINYEESDFDKLNFKGFIYDIGGGIEYLISDNVGVRLNLKHRFVRIKHEDVEIVILNINNLLGAITANIYFRKKAKVKIK